MLKYLPVWLLILLPFGVSAQQVILTGNVLDQERNPLELATVGIKGTTTATQTDAFGKYKLSIPASGTVVIQVRYLGYKEQERTLASINQPQAIDFILQPDPRQLGTIDVEGRKDLSSREQASVTKLDPRQIKSLPSAFGDFNKILVTLPGVSSSNELSSTYAVRGGNYDENLVYVNGMEVYRPFLITAAQQEGLSFVNPDLVSSIEFSSGGWQPKYGDKLSSVLDIKYKQPKTFAASVTGSLTGGALHLESASKNKRISYLLGVRHKNGQYILNSLPQTGEYQPLFSDAQAFVSIELSKDTLQPGRTTLGILASYAQNDYLVEPKSQTTTFGTQQAPLRLFVGFDGKELMAYKTLQSGLNLSHRFTRNFTSELVLSVVQSREREFRDLEAGYRLCELENGVSSSAECQQVRGIGSQYDHARNTLLARILTLESRNTLQLNARNQVQFGIKAGSENIEDQLAEYGFTDSADYVSPAYFLNSSMNLNTQRLNGYVQHTFQLDYLKTLTYGIRMSYWDFNREFTFTPRVQYAFISRHNPNLSFKTAVGLYYQPPFYRELRNQQGQLNSALKAQRSLHAIIGSDYLFTAWTRPFKLTAEAYYKHLTNVIPYDIDNVRLRYHAENNAKAYAAGLDLRVNGEFIPGTESWLSLGLLTTKEDVQGDSVSVYNAAQQLVGKKEQGYIRRPSDQLLNIGVYFEDHLPNNPTVRMNLNLVYGSGLPFGPPRNPEYRNAFAGKSYKRVDIGFSKLIVLESDFEKSRKVSLKSLWIGLEILNLIDARNRVSYSYVQDFNGVTYAVPNFLTGRRLNVRFVAKF